MAGTGRGLGLDGVVRGSGSYRYVSGGFAGIAGALFGIFNRGVFADYVYWPKSAEVMIMTILGGIGHFWGPVVGAATLVLLNQETTSYTEYWSFVLGAILLVLLLRLGKATSEGVTTDLGRAASQIPDPVREFALALAQVGAIGVPLVIVGLLVWQGRWRRLGLVALGAAAGGLVFVLADLYLDLPGRLDDAVSTSTWVTSTRFPSLAYVAGAAGATMVG